MPEGFSVADLRGTRTVDRAQVAPASTWATVTRSYLRVASPASARRAKVGVYAIV